LEKRIIPRATVVQFLLNNGLRNKNSSLIYPFLRPEKLFLDMFIKRFKNESSYLMKLYEEKLKLAHTRDKTCVSWLMIRFLGLLDLICYSCFIFYLKFVWYRQTVIGSNIALFRLTNVGFILIIISSKSYSLSVLITSNNFPVLHVKKLIF